MLHPALCLNSDVLRVEGKRIGKYLVALEERMSLRELLVHHSLRLPWAWVSSMSKLGASGGRRLER